MHRRRASLDDKVVQEFLATLEEHGITNATEFHIQRDAWDVLYDLDQGVITEVRSKDLVIPMAVSFSRCLRKVRVDFIEQEFDQDFFHKVQANTSLQELSISRCGYDGCSSIGHIIKLWYDASSPFRLTLFDLMEDTRGHVLAQLVIRDHKKSLIGGVQETAISCRQQNDLNVHEAIEFLQWDCDHIIFQLSDYFVSLLDMATQQHPSILTSFTLDTSLLTRAGLSSVQNVLHRSRLVHLAVLCTHVDLSLSDSIAQVIKSVQWPTFRSLVFSGDHIDD